MKKLLLTNKQFLLHWKGRTNLAFDLKISVEQNQFQELQENYFVVLLHLDYMCLPPAAAFFSKVLEISLLWHFYHFCNFFIFSFQFFFSSGRSSYSDGDLLYIDPQQPVFEIWNIFAKIFGFYF